MSGREIFDPSDHPNSELAAAVISLAEVRLSRGWKKGSVQCRHRSLVYSSKDRAIECKDCDKAVEPFDAFMLLVGNFSEMVAHVERDKSKAEEALAATLVRRAAKALDKSWGRGMAACCPHCNNGLLPEDFERGVRSSIGKEFEVARRRRAALSKPSSRNGSS